MNRVNVSSLPAPTRLLGGMLLAALLSCKIFAQGEPPAAAAASDPGPQKSPAERQVEYRQALFTVLAGNFIPLNAMASGKVPYEATAVQRRALRVLAIAQMIDDAFPDSSRAVGGTKARSEIWDDPVRFAAALRQLQDRASTLSSLVRSDRHNSSAFQKAVADLGSACKNCHDNFRER